MRSTWLPLIALLLAAAAPAAPADSFGSRIGAGNLVLATPGGVHYEQAYAPAVTAAIAACVPPTGDTGGKFILVADVTRAGLVTAAKVRPATTLARCFTARFTATRLPPPPLPSYAKINYPLVIELNLAP